MTEERFCPPCGKARTGFFRYCGQCGFDFDAPLHESEESRPTPTPAVAQPVPPLATAPLEAVGPGAVTRGYLRPPGQATPRKPRSLLRYATVGVAVLLGLGAISNLTAGPSPLASPSAALASTTPTPASTAPTPTTTPRPSPTFGPTGPTQLATVTSVIDGDTIRVSIDGAEYPVRYIGIDSPEPDSPDPAVKRLADGATAANGELVEGREVTLERDISETDRFGRLLRHVWLIDGATPILVNLELVRRGYAEVATYPPDQKYVALLTAARESALTGKLGIWAPAPTPAPTPTPVPTQARVVEVDDTPYDVESDTRTTFRGVVGDYTYSDVSFPLDRVTVRWSVKAPRGQQCRVSWRIEPMFDGDSIHSTVRVDPGKKVSGNRRYATSFADAGFIVDSTCSAWTMSLQAIESSGGGGGNCDSSYPDVCIPPYPPDLDCPDIEFRRFEVRGPDPHGFDGETTASGAKAVRRSIDR